MRRLLTFASFIFVAACGDSPLAPVQTVDGSWAGLANGYSLSLAMVQVDSVVGGSVLIATVSGTAQGSISGTFVYPDVHLTLTFPDITQAVKYDGTMSQGEAKIFGRMNGSGIVNVEVDVKKK
jgi:hypothetical protein